MHVAKENIYMFQLHHCSTENRNLWNHRNAGTAHALSHLSKVLKQNF